MRSSPERGRWRRGGLAAILALAAIPRCSCEEELIGQKPPGTCEPDAECTGGEIYRLGACQVSRCVDDSDCCPGSTCNSRTGACADQYVDCTDDSACEVPGQACIDYRGQRQCGYPNKDNALSSALTQSCVTSADCDPGRTCFGRRCVVVAPCEAGCPDGQVCDVDSDTCYVMESCKLTCNEGEMLVISDPDTMGGPNCCLPDCACAALPPVQPGQIGFYAAVAAGEDEVLVSAYDRSYGDLVVARYDLEGKRTGVDYVDGFPTTGPLLGSPTGPRGGRIEPGPNVGQHTSIAIAADRSIHVAYYDVDQAALRYAHYSGGRWASTVVDADGDVGMYTSIAVGADGFPRISYLLAEGQLGADPTPKTALKLATARNNAPVSPSDWEVEVIDSRPKPTPPCGGGCSGNEACVDLGNGPACRPTVLGCNPTCQGSTACLNTGGGPACEPTVSIFLLDDFVEGTGLFTSLALSSTGTPYIAYYDRIAGDLRLAQGDGRGGFLKKTLDGADPMAKPDVGQHASLAIGPAGKVAVAYFDASEDDLVYIDVATRTREIVDDGVSAPDVRLVGADASLIFDADGFPAIAYQDPTEIDLWYARSTGSGRWTKELLLGGRGGGQRGTASGFYVSQGRAQGVAYISNVDVDFDEEGELQIDLSLVTRILD